MYLLLRIPLAALLTTLLAASITTADEPDPRSGVYEMRVYTCDPGRLTALHDRFRNHTMGLFAKHGMTNVAYFTPSDEPLAENTLIYFLWHQSKDAATASFTAFRADPEWIEVRTASEKDAKILAMPVESTFLQLTDYSSPLPAARADRIYELRTYVAADGKFEDLHNRFRNHTLKLFEKHGIENIAYFVPTDEPRSTNTLIYLVAHQSREAAAASWKAFIEDPEWKKVYAESEANGALVQKIDSLYLVPTDYTPKPAE